MNTEPAEDRLTVRLTKEIAGAVKRHQIDHPDQTITDSVVQLISEAWEWAKEREEMERRIRTMERTIQTLRSNNEELSTYKRRAEGMDFEAEDFTNRAKEMPEQAPEDGEQYAQRRAREIDNYRKYGSIHAPEDDDAEPQRRFSRRFLHD